MTIAHRDPRLTAGIVGCLTLLVIGWTGILIPSLIRSIEAAFTVDDAAMGVVYLVYVLAYAAGSFGGGPLTERWGRRLVLGTAALVHGIGIAALGLAPAFPAFVLATIPAGFGAGSLDGGANGLVLDLYRERRGRAMNLLHVFFSLGALSAPFIVGRLVDAGVAWGSVFVVSGLAGIVLAIAYGLVGMPSGRRAPDERSGPTSAPRRPGPDVARLLAGPLGLLAVAIAMYVASEVGLSNWLVRFLAPAPLGTATLALSLYWAGIAIGRLLASSIADRFDHAAFTIACSFGLGAAVVAAVLVPSIEASVALFAIAGVASGPVFPMIVAIGGDRHPDRSAAVGGLLTGAANVGSIAYPPLMGLLSVTVGLGVAMGGTGLLAFGTAGVLILSSRTATASPTDPSRGRSGPRGRRR